MRKILLLVYVIMKINGYGQVRLSQKLSGQPFLFSLSFCKNEIKGMLYLVFCNYVINTDVVFINQPL